MMDKAVLEEEAHVLARVAELDASTKSPVLPPAGLSDASLGQNVCNDQEPIAKRSLLQCCICDSSQPKYRCPGCERRTCSLPCVKQHKQDFACDGKRARSKFVGSKAEITEQVLWQDYCLLEDASRQRGAISRPISNSLVTATGASQQGRYRNLARLRSVAASHHIRLEILPDVFERHRHNTSRAHDKAARIYWHVEVVFRKAGVRHHQERVPFARPMHQILDEYLSVLPDNALLRHQLQEYVDQRSELTVFLEQLDQPANDAAFVKVDHNTTLRDAMRNLRVIEYPTLYVALPTELQAYRVVPRPEEMPTPSASNKQRGRGSSTRGRGRGRTKGLHGRSRGRGRGRGRGTAKALSQHAQREKNETGSSLNPVLPNDQTRHFA
eukprot:m.40017 g.40017  ORF g.40017 m.40017 type:complete len:383 (+) comp12725_c0_seq1:110-1258(+)